MRRPLALLVLGAFLATSSFAAGNLPGAVYWPDGSGHTHSDRAQHTSLGFGAELLGYVNVGEPLGEVDVHKDAAGKTWVLASVLSGGFALIDGSDPANPVLVSKVNNLGAYGADAKISDDTNTAFASLQGGGGQGCDLADSPILPMLPVRKGTCGVQVYDTTNKAAPTFLGTLPSSTGGSHMMDYEVMNGVPYIAMAAQGSPAGIPIAVVGANKLPVTIGRAEAGGNHDVTLTMDPLLPVQALALVANGGSGVRVYDITAPALPLELGQWAPSPAQFVHTVMMTVVEGKRIIVAGEETGGSSQLWFLDATDYADMQLLGTWTNPDNRQGAGYRWSTHNFNIADGKLYLAHYHGGVLVFDLGTVASLANPQVVANFFPTMPRCSGCGSFSTDVPFTWDAVPFEGVVWVGDINTGVYAYRLA